MTLLIFLLLLFLPSQLGLHLWPSWSYVFGARVDYLSPTLYLTDLFIFLLVFIHKPRIRISFWILVFIVFNIFCSLSPLVSIFKWLRILEYYALFKILIANHQSPITRPLSISIIWVSLLACLQFLSQSSLGNLWYWLGERTFNVSTPGIAKIVLFGHQYLRSYATFPHPNALAGFLLVSSVVLVHLNQSKKTLITKFALLISLQTIPLTFSRTAIFLEICLLVYYFAPKFKKTLISLVIVLSLLTTYNLQLTTSFTDRLWLGQKAMLAIQHFPLLGTGLGNFPIFQPSFAAPSFALQLQPVHNIFLLLISELGLPFSLFILIKLYKKLSIVNWPLSTPLLIVIATGAVDHYWLTIHQNILLLTVLLALIHIKSKSNELTTDN